MQISSKTVRHGIKGFALTITLILMAVMLTVFASIMFWVSSNSKVTIRNNQYNMSQAAAEAGTERVLASMDQDFLAQSLTTAQYYASLPGTISQSSWPVQYIYSDTNGNSGQITVIAGAPATNSVSLNSQYSGLYGLAQTWTVIAMATPTNQQANVPAKITETVQFASIPVFQFAIFYNMDLDMSPGQDMGVNGKTFSNGSIWCYPGGQMTFNGSVSCAGTYHFASDPNGDQTANISGSPLTPNFNSGAPISNADELALPIGTNNTPSAIEAILNLPPAAYALGTSAAYSTNGQIYLANAADLIITNISTGMNNASPAKGTNLFIFFQDSAGVQPLIQLTNDFYLITNRISHTVTTVTNYIPPGSPNLTNIYYAGWSFCTNVNFYDFRESDTVQAVQIDVAKFNAWLANNARNGGSNWNAQCSLDKRHPIDSIYVYNYVPRTTSQLPAVRMVNGQQMPSANGLTIATPMPVYVKGHYNVTDDGVNFAYAHNTQHTRPAAFLADAITVLSSSWDESQSAYQSGGSYSSRNAVDTTINAACLEGIVVSTNFTGAAAGGQFSGGVENFLRLMENWGSGSDDLVYNGSIVVMFPSFYATNYWQLPGNYYARPNRDWGFDTNYTVQSKLPPLTPQTKAMIRGSWIAQ